MLQEKPIYMAWVHSSVFFLWQFCDVEPKWQWSTSSFSQIWLQAKYKSF
jgi:hypothetical protein